MDKIASKSQRSRKLFTDDIIEAVTNNIRDPEQAGMATEIMQAANSNKELANVLSRIMKAGIEEAKGSIG
jgi:hypothetical protein